MKPENFRIAIGYLNRDMHVPKIRISYFFLTVGRGNSKPPIVIVGIFSIEFILWT